MLNLLKIRPLIQHTKYIRFSSNNITPGPLIESPADEVEKTFSLQTANSKQILHSKINTLVKKFQKHPGDTGSAAVQIAVMTERINNVARHLAQHKKDKILKRNFERMISRRKYMMLYLRRYNFEDYKNCVTELGLLHEARKLQGKYLKRS